MFEFIYSSYNSIFLCNLYIHAILCVIVSLYSAIYYCVTFNIYIFFIEIGMIDFFTQLFLPVIKNTMDMYFKF